MQQLIMSSVINFPNSSDSFPPCGIELIDIFNVIGPNLTTILYSLLTANTFECVCCSRTSATRSYKVHLIMFMFHVFLIMQCFLYAPLLLHSSILIISIHCMSCMNTNFFYVVQYI